jgi:SAM-dependent methyltransferase
MDDFLYRNPHLYEQVFPSRNKAALCISLFEKHSREMPQSVLEVGCGTGRDLSEFANRGFDCVGFDPEPSMVAAAQVKNPGMRIVSGDMRECRLGKQFDAICALGGSINFALTNHDIEKTVETYGAHAHKGTLLIVQPLNSGDFFGTFRAPAIFRVKDGETTLMGAASYNLSVLDQVIERTRVWTAEGQESFSDSMRFRAIFPSELSYFLEKGGFRVVETFETEGGALYNVSMYIVAVFEGP